MYSKEGGIVVANGAESSLVSEVKEKQDEDPILPELREIVYKQRVLAFKQWGYCVLIYNSRSCVFRVIGLQERIIEEVNTSIHSIHQGSK